MFLRKLALVTTVVVAGFLAATAAKAETIRFAVTDMDGMEELQTQYGKFKDALSKAMGVDIEFYPVNSRTVAAEAMRAQKLDFVLVGPSEYVVFQSRVKLVPVIEFTRPDYFSAIVVRRDSHINTLADLKGARIAFNDVGSTSGHIGPSILFKEAGIDPVKDIQPLYLSSPVGYAGMKRGDVRAWGTSQDIYRRLRDADKESQTGDFKVIAHGPDLPNDVVIARADLDPALVTKFRAAFADPATAKILKAALSFTPDGEDHYKLSKFLTDVNDSDYDYIREGYIAIGQPQFAKPTQ